MVSRLPSVLTCLLAIAIAAATTATGQEPGDPQKLHMSRADLDSLLTFFEQSAASPVYGERLRERAEFEGQVVRSRLEGGDFQVGDQVLVVVEGPGGFSDTLTVGAGRVLHFPELGVVDLTGVLRSELGPLLQQFLERFVRQPRLQSTALVRLQLSGAVARPGFYTMPAETPLPDAIMLAGGPSGNVDLGGILIERGGRKLMAGDLVQEALADGRTLDQLNLRGGDRIVVPLRFALGAAEGSVRTFAMLLAIPLSIAGILALFN